jgi:hypothetical protein
MPFRKAASNFLCAGFLTQAGVALAEENMPLPVPRPAATATQVENESQPKARPSGNLDKALKPAEPAARKT